MHLLTQLILGGVVGFTVTLATFFYWVRYFDDEAGFGITAVLFLLTGVGAALGFLVGLFTRPRESREPGGEAIGLSAGSSGQ